MWGWGLDFVFEGLAVPEFVEEVAVVVDLGVTAAAVLVVVAFVGVPLECGVAVVGWIIAN